MGNVGWGIDPNATSPRVDLEIMWKYDSETQ
eukprot:COSAG02_NODE_17967_length_968_cov_1.409666_2_plen_30_part_01